jgi:hypothetical protein
MCRNSRVVYTLLHSHIFSYPSPWDLTNPFFRLLTVFLFALYSDGIANANTIFLSIYIALLLRSRLPNHHVRLHRPWPPQASTGSLNPSLFQHLPDGLVGLLWLEFNRLRLHLLAAYGKRKRGDGENAAGPSRTVVLVDSP